METLKIIYTNTKVLTYVRRKVADVEHLITYTDKLEHCIFRQLCNYYRTSKNKSFRRIKYLVDREIGLAKNRYRLDNSIIFSALIQYDDYGEQQEIEPQDVLANVEDAVIEKSSIKEKIAGLASDDRERFTLNAWIDGVDDTTIAKALASRYGGKTEGHRTFIKRFRAKCQRKLAT